MFKFAPVSIRGASHYVKRQCATAAVAESPADFLEHLRNKGQGKNRLALRDLKKLILMCDEKKKAHHAVRGIKLFNFKSQDFSEEINALFIKQMLQVGAVEQAMHAVTQPKGRLGAHMTPKSSDALLNALAEKPNPSGMVKVLQTLRSKGLKLKTQDMAAVSMKVASASGDEQLYDEALEALKVVLTDADYAALSEQFPRPGADSGGAAGAGAE